MAYGRIYNIQQINLAQFVSCSATFVLQFNADQLNADQKQRDLSNNSEIRPVIMRLVQQLMRLVQQLMRLVQQLMRLDQINIAEIKLIAFLEKSVTQPLKTPIYKQAIPKVVTPLKSGTQRTCILKQLNMRYAPKRLKRQFQSFRHRSFKTPTNACIEHLSEFQQKKHISNLTNQLNKMDSINRLRISTGSPISNCLSNNLLKVSNESLILKRSQNPKRHRLRKVINSTEARPKLSLSLKCQDLENRFMMQKQEGAGIKSCKKYAELTFKEIMEVESDFQYRSKQGKQGKRKSNKSNTQASQMNYT